MHLPVQKNEGHQNRDNCTRISQTRMGKWIPSGMCLTFTWRWSILKDKCQDFPKVTIWHLCLLWSKYTKTVWGLWHLGDGVWGYNMIIGHIRWLKSLRKSETMKGKWKSETMKGKWKSETMKGKWKSETLKGKWKSEIMKANESQKQWRANESQKQWRANEGQKQ